MLRMRRSVCQVTELLQQVREGNLSATDLLLSLRLIFEAADMNQTGTLNLQELTDAVKLYYQVQGCEKVATAVIITVLIAANCVNSCDNDCDND
jgi:hypothetical protein